MNAVEIEEAVSALMAAPFNRAEFPYQFLAAFGFRETDLRKLKTGASNASAMPGAVLLRNNISPREGQVRAGDRRPGGRG